MFSATVVRRTLNQGAAPTLAAKTASVIRVGSTGQWGSRADVRWSSSQEVALALALAEKNAKAMRTMTS